MCIQQNCYGAGIAPVIKSRQVILPDSGKDLLRAELAFALRELGFNVLQVKPEALHNPDSEHYLPRLLDSYPGLFLSVNLQGILPGGASSKILLQAASQNDLTVLCWFVDNPWHILSGLRDPGWKSFILAVTDHTFVEPLRLAGAERVVHFPLAASSQQLESSAGFSGGALKDVVFAGRLAFPGRDAFFAGLELPSGLLEEARKLILKGERTDFNWWVAKLELDAGLFWPGKKSRLPGLGAAQSNKMWREQYIKAAAEQYTKTGGLTVFGDNAWADGLQSCGKNLRADLRPPFDYYAHAHSLYRQASFSLNLNSLLLGGGLTQRIFDIWLSRGFCLTDNSPGLMIFPAELTRPVTFNSPEEMVEIIARFKANPGQKQALTQAWHECIVQEHSYTSRLRKLLCQ
jgi:hypothetical protein